MVLTRRYKKAYNITENNYNKERYLNSKDLLNKTITETKNKYYQKIQSNLKNRNYNSRQFWNTCNTLLKRKIKSNIGDIIYNKKIYKKDSDKVRILGDYFGEQVLNDNGIYDTTNDYSVLPTQLFNYEFPYITKDMVLDNIKKINIHTATGPDKISNIFLKKTGHILNIPLHYIFNYSLIHSVYPKQWKLSHWSPIYKRDSRFKRENYRPISLCSNIGKLLDKIIFCTLYNYLDKYNLLNKYNYGFKRKSSSQHNLSMLLHQVYNNLDKNCDSIILFLDVVKAFDKVDHKILLQKLYSLGIKNIELHWFKNYLSDRYSRCVIHGYESEKYHIQTSVTQGSVLATLLWSIFAHDITDNLITNPYIFADDTALVEKIERNDLQGGFNAIQFDIDQLIHWSKENKLEFSQTKTKYIIISNSHKQIYPDLYFGTEKLERVHSYKQLGLYIDENLNWENHINYIINKLNRLLHMFKLIRKRIDFQSSEKIYKGLIASVLDYCSMFYINATQKNVKRITRLIYQCAIIIVNGNRFLSEEKLLQELGWNKFQDRTNYLSITMFAKIKLTQTPKIIYETFFLNLPKNVGRNEGKLKVIFSKKNKYYNSYYLKMIRMWNMLHKDIRVLTNYSDFLEQMHKKYEIHEYKHKNIHKYDTEIDNLYLKLRFQCSKLNADQFKFNFINNSLCTQCNKQKQETLHHYFMDCDKYKIQRDILKNNLASMHQHLHKLSNRHLIQIIQGKREQNMDIEIYKNIYQFIKLYIVTTGRFS